MDELDSIVNEAVKPLPNKRRLPHTQKRSAKGGQGKRLSPQDKVEAKAVLKQEIEKAKAPKPLSQYSKKAIQEAYRNFEDSVGGRTLLGNALQGCPEEGSANKVAKILNDKDFWINDKLPLYIICKRHHVPLNAVIEAYRDSMMATLNTAAIAKLAEDAGEVVGQVSQDAKNRFDPCPVCLGEQRVRRIGDNGEWLLSDGEYVTQLCYNCRGTGQIFKEHDSTSRKHFLTITGILPDKQRDSAPTINVNQQVGIKGDFLPGDGTFEKFIKAIDVVQTRPALPAAEVSIIDIAVYEPETP